MRLNDGVIGFGELRYPVQNAIQVRDRPQHHPGDEAIVARHLVAFDKFRDVIDQPFHVAQLPRQGPDTHDGLQGIAQRFRIHIQRVGADHTGFLQPPQPVRHAGRRHAHLPRQVCRGGARVGRQGLHQAAVDTIQDRAFVF
ncbi:hypothetical protein D3C71_1557990 [compost metagenome]